MGEVGHRVERLGETRSTNDDARALAIDGAPEGTVVRADRQTEGRGRAGRAWASPEGGLWLSVVLRPRAEIGRWGLIPALTATATRAALESEGAEAALKWPNDLLVGDKKIAGVLVESRPPDYAIVGIGVNANVKPADLPPEVRAIATSAREASGAPIDLDRLALRLYAELDSRYRAFEGGADVLAEYRRHLATLGHEVAAERVRGKAVAVRDDGALILETPEGKRVAVTAGDVGLTGR